MEIHEFWNLQIRERDGKSILPLSIIQECNKEIDICVIKRFNFAWNLGLFHFFNLIAELFFWNF
jgi:hypothetical protein